MPLGHEEKETELIKFADNFEVRWNARQIAESTFKSQRTRFLSSQPTDYQ